MKEKALYHLLLDRGRHILASANGEAVLFLKESQESLKIEHRDGDYDLSWEWRGQMHQLTIPRDSFQFYVRGDMSADRVPVSGLRRKNWSAALAVWQKMFAASGVAYVGESGQDLMALQLAGISPNRLLGAQGIILLSAAAGAVALGVAGPVQGLQVVAISAALLALTVLQDSHITRYWPAALEATIIGVVPALPSLVGASSLFTLLAVSAALLWNVAERCGGHSILPWTFAGLATGMCLLQDARAGAAMAVTACVAVLLIHLVMPVRLSRRVALAYVASTGITAGLIVFVVPIASLQSHGLMTMESVAGAVVTAMLLACFMSWWLVGRMFYIGPWFTFAFLGIGGGVLLLQNSRDSLLGFTGVMGFALFALLRVATALFRSRLGVAVEQIHPPGQHVPVGNPGNM